MSGGLDVIMLGQAMAAACFFVALWPHAGVAAQWRPRAAVAGTVILSAAAIYDMDVINGPEIIAVLLAGSAVGWLAGREWLWSRLIALLAVFAGCAGAALLFAALAVRLNPYAFGLVDDDAADIATRYLLMLVAAVVAGGGACICAIAGLFRREGKERLLAALAVGMAGWSAAAMAFLLQNPGLLVAGGLAGAAGTGVALRLCGGPQGKGLADALDRP